MIFHSLYLFFPPLTLFSILLLYQRARVLSVEPSFALFRIPFVQLSSIFAASLLSPVSITILPLYFPYSFIFSPRTVISSSLSHLFLTTFYFYLFLLLSFLSITDSLSIHPPYFCDLFHFLFSQPSFFRKNHFSVF